MDARHYAPRARLVVLRDRRMISSALAQALANQEIVGAVFRGSGAVIPSEAAMVRVLPDDPAHYAHELFAALHALDEAGCDVVLIEAVPEDDERWWAVADRLRRASVR